MPPRLEPQLAMDERAINDPDLEAALERRLRALDDRSEASAVVNQATDEVNGHIARIAPDFGVDDALRVGRFRITKKHLDGGTVSFERSASDRIQYALVDADGQPTRRTNGRAPKSEVDGDDWDDLRPKGDVNADALRGEADRS